MLAAYGKVGRGGVAVFVVKHVEVKQGEVAIVDEVADSRTSGCRLAVTCGRKPGEAVGVKYPTITVVSGGSNRWSSSGQNWEGHEDEGGM